MKGRSNYFETYDIENDNVHIYLQSIKVIAFNKHILKWNLIKAEIEHCVRQDQAD